MDELQTLAGVISPGPIQTTCDDEFIRPAWINPGGIIRFDVPGDRSKAWVRTYVSGCDPLTGIS